MSQTMPASLVRSPDRDEGPPLEFFVLDEPPHWRRMAAAAVPAEWVAAHRPLPSAVTFRADPLRVGVALVMVALGWLTALAAAAVLAATAPTDPLTLALAAMLALVPVMLAWSSRGVWFDTFAAPQGIVLTHHGVILPFLGSCRPVPYDRVELRRSGPVLHVALTVPARDYPALARTERRHDTLHRFTLLAVHGGLPRLPLLWWAYADH